MKELLIKKNELGGIYTALVSPIKDETLDVAYQDKIIEYQIENGVSGIVIFGTTGQNPCFTWEEQVKRTIEIANKFKDKTRIIFCFSSNCTREVIKKMEEIEKCLGPVTFLSTTGYYNKPGQKGQVKHFEKIANSIKGNLIIYEVPGRTNVSMNEESWRELSKIENIIGIKDATNLAGEKKRIEFFNDLGIVYLTGEDGVYANVLNNNGKGIISASTNVALKVFKEIENENNEDKRNELQNKANEIVNLVFCATNPVPLAYFLKTQVLLPLCIEDISSENKEKIDKVIEENKEMLFTKTS